MKSHTRSDASTKQLVSMTRDESIQAAAHSGKSRSTQKSGQRPQQICLLKQHHHRIISRCNPTGRVDHMHALSNLCRIDPRELRHSRGVVHVMESHFCLRAQRFQGAPRGTAQSAGAVVENVVGVLHGSCSVAGSAFDYIAVMMAGVQSLPLFSIFNSHVPPLGSLYHCR